LRKQLFRRLFGEAQTRLLPAIMAQKTFSLRLPRNGRSNVSIGRNATGMPVAVLNAFS
jgi:hypothetical protein